MSRKPLWAATVHSPALRRLAREGRRHRNHDRAVQYVLARLEEKPDLLKRVLFELADDAVGEEERREQ